MTRTTEYFLSQIPNPVSRSLLLVTLAAGQPIKVQAAPVDLLPALVLLAACGRFQFNQQIVDDYHLLLQRMQEVFHNAQLAHKDYYSEQLCMVSQIVNDGPRTVCIFGDYPEAQHIPSVYEEITHAELSDYFKQESGKRSSEGNKKARRASAAS